jgi:hypothetical protein
MRNRDKKFFFLYITIHVFIDQTNVKVKFECAFNRNYRIFIIYCLVLINVKFKII